MCCLSIESGRWQSKNTWSIFVHFCHFGVIFTFFSHIFWKIAPRANTPGRIWNPPLRLLHGSCLQLHIANIPFPWKRNICWGRNLCSHFLSATHIHSSLFTLHSSLFPYGSLVQRELSSECETEGLSAPQIIPSPYGGGLLPPFVLYAPVGANFVRPPTISPAHRLITRATAGRPYDLFTAVACNCTLQIFRFPGNGIFVGVAICVRTFYRRPTITSQSLYNIPWRGNRGSTHPHPQTSV